MIPASRFNQNAWARGEEDPLWLLTQAEFDQLADGTVVESIHGVRKTKGVDYIDDDVRFGMLAYGFRESDLS